MYHIDIPHTYLRITGKRADEFREMFVRELVSKEGAGGRERARTLLAAEKYIIKIEQEGSGLKYKVALGNEGDSFIAIGPNLARRLVSEAVPLMAVGGLKHRMAPPQSDRPIPDAFDPVPAG